MPPSTKPKRATRSISLPPALDAKLQAEADERVMNPSVLVERALDAFLPSLPKMNGDDTSTPGANPPDGK